jgi:hypothetical protein
MYGIAGEFFYREMECRRKGLTWQRDFLGKLWLSFARLVFGYGEKPERILATGFAVIFGLAFFAYFLGGAFGRAFPESLLNSLYYSSISFTALGYGSWALQPERWAQGLGALEAIFGVVMIALFVTMMVRKLSR